MIPHWPRAGGEPAASAVLRRSPADFRVDEQLGFEPEGSGEHVFLRLEKRLLTTAQLVQRVSELSGVHPRDIGYSGLKDRHAETRQWLSVGLAGRAEPAWRELEAAGDVRLLAVARHRRKLKTGVHRANRFEIVLRQVAGDEASLRAGLARVAARGVPNYFGEQRFGRGGNNIAAARGWADSGGRLPRARRSLYLSTLRALLFNAALAERVEAGDWGRVIDGDVCVLLGSRSVFTCERVDADIEARAGQGDISPGLPLWGAGAPMAAGDALSRQRAVLTNYAGECDFLERRGLSLEYRTARVFPDDFSWEFCDHDALRLQFSLPAGSFATALLAELVRYGDGDSGSDTGSE